MQEDKRKKIRQYCHMRGIKMKKFLSVLLTVMIIVLTGCGTNKRNEESSKITLFEDSSLDYLTVQFKTDKVNITDDEKIQAIKKIFEGEIKRNEKLDDEKGWIYKITGKDSNDNPIEEFFVINDTHVRIKDKTYTCNEIDISKLDEIIGSERENGILN